MRNRVRGELGSQLAYRGEVGREGGVVRKRRGLQEVLKPGTQVQPPGDDSLSRVVEK